MEVSPDTVMQIGVMAAETALVRGHMTDGDGTVGTLLPLNGVVGGKRVTWLAVW